MTSLGEFYHDRYFSSSSPNAIKGLSVAYDANQISAFVADTNDDVWAASAWAFIQGLYPPIEDTTDKNDPGAVQGSSLSNGSVAIAPLKGYQYVFYNSIDATSDEGYQVLGQSNCPASNSASLDYLESSEFSQMNQSTLSFYQSLYPVASADFEKEDLNFGNAFNIHDYFLVESIHNKTFVEMFKHFDKSLDEVLSTLQVYQGIYSRNYFYNPNQVKNSTIEARSLLQMILNQLNQTQTTSLPYISYTVGAYSTFYELFGLMGLYEVDESIYTGMVNYGASMAFELIKPSSSSSSLDVRVSFMNGTNSSFPLQPIKIFGLNTTLIPYETFVSNISSISIKNTQAWCNACGAWSSQQCALYNPEYLEAKAHDFKMPLKLSLVAAGGIGAGVAIGACLIGAGVVCLGIWAWKRWSRPDLKLTAIEPSAIDSNSAGGGAEKDNNSEHHSSSSSLTTV